MSESESMEKHSAIHLLKWDNKLEAVSKRSLCQTLALYLEQIMLWNTNYILVFLFESPNT